MTADIRKKITSKLLQDTNDSTTASSSNNQIFDAIVTKIDDDEVNRTENNNIALEIAALTNEYSYITNYKHQLGLTNVTSITYFPDISIGSTHSALPITQSDIQEYWDGAALLSGNIFYVPTPNMANGATSQKLTLDPTSDYDVTTSQESVTVVDPVVPKQYSSFGNDTLDLITGYTEIDGLNALIWAINCFFSGQSGTSKVTNAIALFNSNGYGSATIDNYSFSTGITIYLNYNTFYCIATVINPAITIAVIHNDSNATYYTYTPNGNNFRVLATNSMTEFYINSTISSNVTSSSTTSKNLMIMAVSNLINVINTEISIIQGNPIQSINNINAVSSLIVIKNALNIWYNYTDDVYSTGKWNTTNINTLLTIVNSRLSYISTRKNQILTNIVIAFNNRIDVAKLRLSKNNGTLNAVFRTYLQALKSIKQTSQTSNSINYYSKKFILQIVTTDADNSKNIYIKNNTGLNIGDNVYIITDDQPEVYTSIIAMFQEQQDDPDATSIPIPKINVWRIVLADRISNYYTTSNNLRLAKQLSE